MTTIEIIMACIGMLICAILIVLAGIVTAGIIWWTFRTDKDIVIDPEDWEEESWK